MSEEYHEKQGNSDPEIAVSTELDYDTALAPDPHSGSRSATLKVFLLMFLAFLMLLPVSWLLGLVREREGRLSEARQRIESGWGGAQQLHGPLLYVPYRCVATDESGNSRECDDAIYLAATRLEWQASLDPEIRSLGIFDALLYRGDLVGQASFDLSELDLDPSWIHWDRARVLVEVTDLRGIDGIPTIEWNGKALEVGPAVDIPGIVGFGAALPTAVQNALAGPERPTGAPPDGDTDAGTDESAAIPGTPPTVPAETLRVTVDVRLSLAGSERLTLVPSAADTQLAVRAPWPSPSFVGAHLPRQRELTDDGFNAEWQVPSLARSLPRRWSKQRQKDLGSYQQLEAFGVELMLPAGGYQRIERAAKYALLFVGLTFLAFFLFEVLSELRLHPIQYLLVAAALVVFYLLLLALSEHVGFNLAYAVAALATCGLIAGYSRSVLGSGKRAGIVLFELSLLYAYLFIVLAAEDFALLFGATGLFAVLGLVMWLTRHLDWYEMGRRPIDSPG
ncbi:MAG: cell envelope integrity protein CreD [Thermoanaerobaculia bacterium]|nr:cell envelope integrity protein CreD [Thermoanaerobaculia bacterium]